MTKDLIELEKYIEKNEKKIDKNASKIEKILEQLESNSNKIQANSVALDILKDYKKQNKRAFIVIIIQFAIIISLSIIVVAHHLIK